MKYDPNPPRFEDEYPEVGAFLMRVYAAGGWFKQPVNRFVILPELPPIVGLTQKEINDILINNESNIQSNSTETGNP